MRCLLKITLPTEEANAAMVGGSFTNTVNSILKDTKPEASYFLEEHGVRMALIVVNVKDSSEIPAIAEPWFHAFNAKVEFHPAMNLDDLKSAGSAMERALRKYGRVAKS